MAPVLLFAALLTAQAAEFTHQGRLLDSLGEPVTGAVDLDVELLDDQGGLLDTADAGQVTVSDGYYSVVLNVSDAVLADTRALRVLVDQAPMTDVLPVTSVPNAASLSGHTVADLDARHRMGITQLSWDDDGNGNASSATITGGAYCSSRTLSPSVGGNYLVTGRWTVVTSGSGSCRYVNCWLAVDGVMVGQTYNADDGLQSVNASVSSTYRTGSIEGVVALDAGGDHTAQWYCQKADNCALTVSVQCDRNQVIVRGPYGDF